MTVCAHQGCKRHLSKGNRSGLCHSHYMNARNADPAFRAAASARMKKLSEDPDFSSAQRAGLKRHNDDPKSRDVRSKRLKALHAQGKLNPLANLSPTERADYNVLRKKAGYSRNEAFAAIGRSDLIKGGGASRRGSVIDPP